jgi:hypothetical protein
MGQCDEIIGTDRLFHAIRKSHSVGMASIFGQLDHNRDGTARMNDASPLPRDFPQHNNLAAFRKYESMLGVRRFRHGCGYLKC